MRVCVCTDLSVLCDPSELRGVKNQQHQTHCLSVAKGQRLRIYIVSGIYLNLQTRKQSGLIASTVFHSGRVRLCAPCPRDVRRFGCVGFGCLTVRPVRIITPFPLQEGKGAVNESLIYKLGSNCLCDIRNPGGARRSSPPCF